MYLSFDINLLVYFFELFFIVSRIFKIYNLDCTGLLDEFDRLFLLYLPVLSKYFLH